MRGAAVLLGGLVLAAGAEAAPPAVTAVALPAAGVAPLEVALTASGDAATYSWDLGDGTLAEGPFVTHIYGPGRFVATVTATGPAGEQAQAQVVVTATERKLALETPRSGAYGARVLLAGSLRPARAGARIQIYRGRTYVTSARLGANGRFRTPLLLRLPGPYEARYGSLRSETRRIVVKPALETSLDPTLAVGTRAVVRVRVRPAGAGTVVTRVRRGKRLVASGNGSGAPAHGHARPATDRGLHPPA